MDYAFALALATALLDVTLGLHAPSRGLEIWLRIVRGAAGGPLGVALYFAPVGVAAAAVAQSLPEGPLGFAATALLASLFCGRQSLDRRGRAGRWRRRRGSAPWRWRSPRGAPRACCAWSSARRRGRPLRRKPSCSRRSDPCRATRRIICDALWPCTAERRRSSFSRWPR